MPGQSLTISSCSPDHTCELARALAPRLLPGDVILLSGEVGAGKTHFARCLIQASLTIPEDVPSPTYTLVQVYPGQNAEIWHSDLYRLSNVSEVEELGLLEAFTEAICLVEWPDRLGDLCPDQALHITMQTGQDEHHRQIDLRWSDARWNTKLTGLTNV